MSFDSLLLLASRFPFSLHHKQAFIAIFKDFSPLQKVSRYTPSQTWELKTVIPGTGTPIMGDSPLMVSFFPYDSHIKILGFLWEWYGNSTGTGYPLLRGGSLEIPHDDSIPNSSNSKLPVVPHVVRLQKVVKQENDTNASVEPGFWRSSWGAGSEYPYCL